MSDDIWDTTIERSRTMSQGRDQPYVGDMYVGRSFYDNYNALRSWLGMSRDICDAIFENL